MNRILLTTQSIIHWSGHTVAAQCNVDENGDIIYQGSGALAKHDDHLEALNKAMEAQSPQGHVMTVGTGSDYGPSKLVDLRKQWQNLMERQTRKPLFAYVDCYADYPQSFSLYPIISRLSSEFTELLINKHLR